MTTVLAFSQPPIASEYYVVPAARRESVRKVHLQRAVVEVARIVRDLVTIVPLAFLKGAIVGPMWIASTFAFGLSLWGVGGSVTSTICTVALIGGSATAVLAFIPHLVDHVKQVRLHLRWARDPLKMAHEELSQQTRYHSRIAITGVICAVCLAAMWPLLMPSLLALSHKVNSIDLDAH